MVYRYADSGASKHLGFVSPLVNSINVERIITCPFFAFILTGSLSLEIPIDAAIDVDDQGSIFIHSM